MAKFGDIETLEQVKWDIIMIELKEHLKLDKKTGYRAAMPLSLLKKNKKTFCHIFPAVSRSHRISIEKCKIIVSWNTN